MDYQPKLKIDVGNRDNAKGRLEDLGLPPSEQSVLFAIFEQLWPPGQEKCSDNLIITIPELIQATKLSKGTISPKLGNLAERGFLRKGKDGKFLELGIIWTNVFALKGELKPVQAKPDRSNWTGQIAPNTGPMPLDRSNAMEPELDRSNLDDTNFDRSNWTDDELDRSNVDLDPSKLDQSQQPQDCFTPVERALNWLEDMSVVQQESRDLLAIAVELLQKLVRQLSPAQPVEATKTPDLDRSSSKSDRSNLTGQKLDRSNHPAPLNELNSKTELNHSIEFKSEIGPVQFDRSKPIPAKWHPGRQLTRKDLESNATLFELWTDAVTNFDWLSGDQGLLDLITLAEFNLKIPGEDAAAAFISGVNKRCYGPHRHTDEDANRSARSRFAKTFAKSRDSPHVKNAIASVAEQLGLVRTTIDDLTRDQCLSLFVDYFGKQRFRELEREGKDPRKDRVVRAELEKLLRRKHAEERMTVS